jgi:hypothetical protein
MPSTIRDLTELTAVAVDDYLLISDTSDLTNRDKRISTANLQLGVAKKTGTPVAGRVASWADANTVNDGGFATSDIARLSQAQTFAAAQSLTQIKAASAAGMTIEDDGGNVGLAIADGGVTTIANSLFVTPPAGAVRGRTMGSLYEYNIQPGTLLTTNTWTVDITLVNAGSNFQAVLDIAVNCSAGANPPTAIRAMYRASISFYRTTSGASGQVIVTTPHISNFIGVTLTGPTQIADGIRFTIVPTVATINRNGMWLSVLANTAPAVTSTVT